MGKQLKSVALQFQKNGADALFNIFSNNSRAFLADEAGLGKTFTATILMKKLAEQHFQQLNNIFLYYILVLI
jgi:predicted helicase